MTSHVQATTTRASCDLGLVRPCLVVPDRSGGDLLGVLGILHDPGSDARMDAGVGGDRTMAIQRKHPLPAHLVDESECIRLGKGIPALVPLLPNQNAFSERALEHPAHRYLAQLGMIIETAADVR